MLAVAVSVSTRPVVCVSVCTLGVVPIINHWPPGLGPVPSSPIRPPLVLGQIRKLRLTGRDRVSLGQG